MRLPPRGVVVVVAAALLGLTVGAAVRSFAWYPLRVASNSMSPTVAAGDWVVIAAPRPGSEVPVERGDVVLFRFPPGSEGRAIKRVVAVAGDEVRTAGPNVVLVNGDAPSYGSSPRRLDDESEISSDTTIRIPDGSFFILGDNLLSSVDSRSLGLLPQSEVVGKVAAVIRTPW